MPTSTRRLAVAAAVVIIALPANMALQSSSPARAQNWQRPDVGASSGSSFKLGEMAAFETKSPPAPVPDISFEDATGKKVSLGDFKGKAVLLNVWATWCAPCRAEMPALDRLQLDMGAGKLRVIALSIDRQGYPAARKFLDSIKANAVSLFSDASGKARTDLGLEGMPTTIVINKQGLEIGRFAGAARWDSEEARKLIEPAL